MASGLSWNAPSSTPIRGAGNTPLTPLGLGLPRARPCFGAGSVWSGQAAFTLSAQRSQKMPQPLRSCAMPFVACGLSIGRLDSLWARAPPPKFGRGNCAGAPETSDIPRLLFSRAFVRQPRAVACRCLRSRCVWLFEWRCTCCIRRHLVWLRGAPCAYRRLARHLLVAACLGDARCVASRFVGPSLAWQYFQLARQRYGSCQRCNNKLSTELLAPPPPDPRPRESKPRVQSGTVPRLACTRRFWPWPCCRFRAEFPGSCERGILGGKLADA